MIFNDASSLSFSYLNDSSKSKYNNPVCDADLVKSSVQDGWRFSSLCKKGRQSSCLCQWLVPKLCKRPSNDSKHSKTRVLDLSLAHAEESSSVGSSESERTVKRCENGGMNRTHHHGNRKRTHSKPASPAIDPSRIFGASTNGIALDFSFKEVTARPFWEGAKAEAVARRAAAEMYFMVC